jgi:phosphohistidine phosphatase SixA
MNTSIIYARHAETKTVESDELSDVGHYEGALLATALKLHLTAGAKPALFSAPAGRTVATAEYFEQAFGIRMTVDPAFANNKRREAVRKLLTIADLYQILIIVGHVGEASNVLKEYALQALKIDISPKEVEYGQANILNCDRGTVELFVPRMQ